MNYVSRSAEARLLSLVNLFPGVVLTGPRQSGKSTLLRHLFPNASYVSFDDPAEELFLAQDPQGFLARFDGQVILDEVQRAPTLFRYLKMKIDARPDLTGQYLLTGSNQFAMMRGASESLAGRVGLMKLLPFETLEIPENRRERQVWSGSYPGLVNQDYRGLRDWYSSYLGTYLDRDLRLVHDIGKLSDFQLLVRLLAARTGQELNASSLSKEIGVSAKTVDSWISVLEAGYLVFRLAPFHGNLGKRLIKRPKIYFWDTGLVAALCGLGSQEQWEGSLLKGPLFENLVVSEFCKRSAHRGSDTEFWYYRDNAGSEADLIAFDKSKRSLQLFEIKSGMTAKSDWIGSIDTLAPLLAQNLDATETLKAVIYRGATLKPWPTKDWSFFNWIDVARLIV